MAGVKGRSGGARSGAGRKPKEKPKSVEIEGRDPLQFLLDVMQGLITPSAEQLKAAQTAVQYMHPKKGESSGKKEAAEDAQKAAASGRFGMREAPRLATAGGKAI